MLNNKQQANTANIKVTNNTHVKHARFITAMQAAAQNKANAHLYTAQQHAQAQALAQALQAQYFTKNVYTNARKTHLSVTVSNTTSLCTNLLVIAKKFNAQIVVSKVAITLRLQ